MVRTGSVFAALGLLVAAPSAFAQTPPEIQKILDESAGAYRKANAFSTTFETVRTGAQASTTRLTLTRDGKLSAVINAGTETRHVVADGTNIFSDTSQEPKK